METPSHHNKFHNKHIITTGNSKENVKSPEIFKAYVKAIFVKTFNINLMQEIRVIHFIFFANTYEPQD